ncbi:MAG: dihydropteroate synthase [Spirochaetota bacterium]
MNMKDFIAVGENIHCTRVVKRGGARTAVLPSGGEGVIFTGNGEKRLLPIPGNWAEISPSYADGKIRHIALAIYQALHGKGGDKKSGEDYLCRAAEEQIENGAKFLDINVDEYTNDKSERIDIMKWLSTFMAERFKTPLSIDSSNVEVLEAGLECSRKDTTPLVNSVSLEREEAVDVVIQYRAHAIVSAAGRKGLPCTVDERLVNFREIIGILSKQGMPLTRMHLDALVFPISVDPMNGKYFLEASARVKQEFSGVNLNGGLSNISFGMPQRKILNLVFTRLFTEAGGNGGIIDPVQMPPAAVSELDPDSPGYTLARAVLEGTDMFGIDYIRAHREGRL